VNEVDVLPIAPHMRTQAPLFDKPTTAVCTDRALVGAIHRQVHTPDIAVRIETDSKMQKRADLARCKAVG